LLKLSISQIKKTKLYNFKGEYFNKLYEEALHSEQRKGDDFLQNSVFGNKSTKYPS